MCGIVGIYEKGKDNLVLMDKMLDVIAHRGPDDKTHFQHQNTTLGHRRLSIIDLNTGNQPMISADSTKVIVYNGEIYNYKEIRAKLIGRGRSFKTESDTEVILQAYEEYGSDSVKMLNGIFSFVIYDKNRETLFIARDHFGIKPLHYFWDQNLFIFASEQKAIIQHPLVPRELNKKALHLHMNLRYTPGNETLFKGIKRLPPGHFLVFERGKLEIKKYFQLTPQLNQRIKEDEAIEKMHFYLKQAVQRQLISDVAVGVYLSGGLDSSTIVQKMHEIGVSQINTFTLGFNEPTDEHPDARQVAKHFNTNHKELNLTMNPLDDLSKVIWHAEEPKINLLQGYNMSKFVQPHVKVVLGGLGGDELFAGYDIHKFIYPFNGPNKYTPKWLTKLLNWKANFIFNLQNNFGALKWDEYRRGIQMLLSIGQIEKFYLIIRNTWDFDNAFYKNVYSSKFINEHKEGLPKVISEFQPYFNQVKESSSLDQVLFTEFHTKMVDDYLLVEDRMSMANSVEERVPFLDLDLVNFGFSIPVELKIKHNKTKYLFRKAMEDRLPSKIITKKKWGFTVNPYLQFKKDLKSVSEDVLTPEFIEKQGIFNYSYLRKILDAQPHPKMRWHYNYLWMVLGLAIWEEEFLNKK